MYAVNHKCNHLMIAYNHRPMRKVHLWNRNQRSGMQSHQNQLSQNCVLKAFGLKALEQGKLFEHVHLFLPFFFVFCIFKFTISEISQTSQNEDFCIVILLAKSLFAICYEKRVF